MIGSYHHSNGFNSCNYIEVGDPEFRKWFWPPSEHNDLNAVSISHATQVSVFNTLLRRTSGLEYPLADSKPGILHGTKWWFRTHGLGWVCDAIFGIFVIICILTGIALVPVGIAMVGVGFSLLIGFLGIALGLVISWLIVVPLAVILFLILAVAVQIPFNLIAPPAWRWYLWDIVVSIKFEKWFESNMIDRLPAKWQRLFYSAVSKPIVPSDMSDSDWLKYRRNQIDGYNVVNIMLVSRRSEHGRDVYERLAIGTVSVTDWWKSKPRRHEIVLR